MGQAAVLEILENIKNKHCPSCKGKGCEECFKTGKQLITAREIAEIIEIRVNNVNEDLNKLMDQGLAKHFTKLIQKKGDPPKKYLWKLQN